MKTSDDVRAAAQRIMDSRPRSIIDGKQFAADIMLVARAAMEAADRQAAQAGEVARLREIVKEAWRLWADITGGRPIYPQLDGGFAVVRISPERLAAFDALFRTSAPLADAPAAGAGEDRIPPAGAITQNPEIAAGTIIDVGRHVSDAPAVAPGASDAGDGDGER